MMVCRKCGKLRVRGQGLAGGIAFVGEGVGDAERKAGRPFAGRSGLVLRGVLSRLGVGEAYFTNARECDCERGRSELLAELEANGPFSFVVALGRDALHMLSDDPDLSVGALEGTFVEVPDVGAVGVLRNPAAILWEAESASNHRSAGFDKMLGAYWDWQLNLETLLWGPGRPDLGTQVTRIEGRVEAQAFLAGMPGGEWSIDVEATSTDWWEADLLLISLACQEGQAWTFERGALDADWPAIFQDNRYFWVAHNGHYDYLVLYRKYGVGPRIGADTRLRLYAANAELGGLAHKGLKPAARRVLGVRDWAHLVGNARSGSFASVSGGLLTAYGGRDADATLRLYRALPVENVALQDFLVSVSQTVSHMDSRGVWVDWDYGRQLIREKEAAKEAPRALLSERYGSLFNPNAHPQVSRLLYDICRFPVLARTKTGKPSTDESTLLWLAEQVGDDPVLRALVVFRKLVKDIGFVRSFLPPGEFGPLFDSLEVGGHVYTSTMVDRTVTGRMAQGKPSLLTCPRDPAIRRLFAAPPGYVLVGADYSQNELRVAAAIRQDEAMVALLQQGHDFHSAAAEVVFGAGYTREQRSVVKGGNFAYAYSGSVKSAVGGWPEEYRTRAVEIDRQYRKKFPRWSSWFQDIWKDWIASTGYVEVPSGRRWYFPLDLVTGKLVWEVQKRGVNFICQALSDDMLLDSLVVLERRLPEAFFSLRWSMHDGLYGYAPEHGAEDAAEAVRLTMLEVGNRWLGGVVPAAVDVKIGANWGAL